jgi:glutaredoxin
MTVEHVDGVKKGTVMLYALSTCEWCRMTKELLVSLGVDFSYEYVDLLDAAEQRRVYEEFQKYKAKWGFPLLVIDGGRKVIQGLRDDDIKEALA